MSIKEITELKESTELVTDGKALLTLDFGRAVPLGWIVFRNSYTATLGARCRADRHAAWTTVLRHMQLMPHPHCIEGAQDPVVLSYTEVAPGVLDKVREVQLELRQPSPHWVKFGVSDLHCFQQPDVLDTAAAAGSAGAARAMASPLLAESDPAAPADPAAAVRALERTVTAVTELVASVASEFTSVEGDHDSYVIDTLEL